MQYPSVGGPYLEVRWADNPGFMIGDDFAQLIEFGAISNAVVAIITGAGLHKPFAVETKPVVEVVDAIGMPIVIEGATCPGNR